MAIPSGSGTEVLKRAYCSNFTSTTTYIDWAVADGETDAGNSSATATRVPANVIITILDFIICRWNGGTGTVTVKLEHASNDNIWLLRDYSIGGKSTFSWNDKMVLREGDELSFYSANDENDCWINYIYQDWT